MEKDEREDFLLKSYLNDVRDYNLISRDREVELAQEIAERNNEARNELALANVRLVIKIAMDFDGYGLSIHDLIQEGNTGLMKAVDRFDPTKGAKFSTYAAWWIKQAIKRALSNSGFTVRIPVHLAQSISNLNRFRENFEKENGRLPNNDEIKRELGLVADTVDAAKTVRNGRISLDSKFGESEISLSDILEDETSINPSSANELDDQLSNLADLVNRLSNREKKHNRVSFRS
jgi:RNA polymerase primary sigma factor